MTDSKPSRRSSLLPGLTLILVSAIAAADPAPAKVEAALLSGALQAAQPRGYVDALLRSLDIDTSSQLLVFSRTSLQAAHISSTKPRAIWFNDDTYVAWVQDSDTFEVVAIDPQHGPRFYTVHNTPPARPTVERETVKCLACHDSAGMRPGGFPRVLVKSAPVEAQMNPAGRMTPADISQATPLELRWGGWYVTGSLGTQLHLGNLPLPGAPDPVVRGIHNRSNLDSLAPHFDTSPYPTPRSDIVAFLVLEHQSHVQNFLTRAHADLRTVVKGDEAWAGLDEARRAKLRDLLEPLAQAMTFQDEQPLFGRIRGGSGFDRQFSARGPHDPAGRSLRDFDLTHRTFRYPLSYLVYSAQFQALPLAAREHLWARFGELLGALSGDAALDADRKAALEILAATVPRPGS